MEIEVKQRNRRRKRAQRMQQQLKETKVSKANLDESEAEDVIPKKPPRPPNRRKKQKELQKEPLCEEDIIDGFAILQFRSYEDLELVLKISTKENLKRLTEIERPKLEPKALITNHLLPLVHNTTTHHGLTTLSHDPATSDDSGRASERLTGSSVAPRDADSSRDRLSDASSRCSSGKGYICDSEGEDDKGSDASSVIFASAPASRKHEFPGALPPSLPSLPHGPSTSPVPAPTPPNLPVPSPAPAQQPPIHPPQAIPSAAVSSVAATTASVLKDTKVGGGDVSKAMVVEPNTPVQPAAPSTIIPQAAVTMPSVPAASMPQPAAAAPAAHHPGALESGIHPGAHAMRTDSPAVATSANAAVAPSPGQYHHSYQPHQPLYAPYAHTGSTPYSNNGTPYTSTSTPYTNSSTPYTSCSTPYSTSTTVTAAIPPPSAIVSTGPPLQPVVASVGPAHIEREKQLRPPSPTKVLSPNVNREPRERESYSVSSLCRSSVATTSHTLAPPTTAVSSSLSSSLSKPAWPVGAVQTIPSATPAAAQLSPVPPRPTPPLHSTYPPAAAPPIFAAPLAPPPVSAASPLTTAPPANPNPFSAESLFQTNQADMLRRELDNRFLASQDRSIGVAPPPYLRTEMHQHQHHHTHVHQHTTSLLPPPAASTLFPSQLSMSPMERLARRTQSSFKDIPKLGSVDSPFYRQNIGMPNYPGYTPGIIGHPGLTTGPTPFVPPNHLPTFQPKSMTPQDPTKPKIMKTGKWNAMHVRVAWEIYHHQQKSGEAKGNTTIPKTASDLLRPPTHLFSPSVHASRPPHEMAPFPPGLGGRPPGFDQPHHPGSLFTAPPGHLGKSPFATASSISPFTRYGGGPLGASTASPFSVNPFGTRESHLGLGPLHHDPWRLQRAVPGFPPTVNPLPPTLPGPAPWTMKPDPVLEQREREAREREERERERLRREREERERRDREEKQRRLEQQQQQERERERREKERREMERREMEKRERERELLLHQQRLAESAKQQLVPPVIRDRSPMRNGQADISEIRVKEEPRTKEEDLMARAADHRYHPFLRHPANLQPPPPSVLDRSRMLTHPLPPHYPAPASHWPPPPTDPYYRYGYNPLMDVMRVQEERERANFFSAYGHPGQLRPKDPSLLHLRGGPGPPPNVGMPPVHKMSVTPPTDLHKKEEPR